MTKKTIVIKKDTDDDDDDDDEEDEDERDEEDKDDNNNNKKISAVARTVMTLFWFALVGRPWMSCPMMCKKGHVVDSVRSPPLCWSSESLALTSI